MPSAFTPRPDHFARGDEVTISGWLFIASGQPFGFFDLEASWISSAPVPRLVLGEDDRLYVELEWADKPTYRQAPSSAVAFPHQTWVHVRVRYLLSEAEDGRVQVWQNEQLIIDARGRTLPIPYAVLGSFEAGITANNHIEGPTVVRMDDVMIELTR